MQMSKKIYLLYFRLFQVKKLSSSAWNQLGIDSDTAYCIFGPYYFGYMIGLLWFVQDKTIA